MTRPDGALTGCAILALAVVLFWGVLAWASYWFDRGIRGQQ